MLFYGPSGAGKKTRITATLRQLFGAGVEKAYPCLIYIKSHANVQSLCGIAENRPACVHDAVEAEA